MSPAAPLPQSPSLDTQSQAPQDLQPPRAEIDPVLLTLQERDQLTLEDFGQQDPCMDPAFTSSVIPPPLLDIHMRSTFTMQLSNPSKHCQMLPTVYNLTYIPAVGANNQSTWALWFQSAHHRLSNLNTLEPYKRLLALLVEFKSKHAFDAGGSITPAHQSPEVALWKKNARK